MISAAAVLVFRVERVGGAEIGFACLRVWPSSMSKRPYESRPPRGMGPAPWML